MIRRKTRASRTWRKADRQLRIGISPQVAQQLLSSSLSFYLRIYICTLSKLQVSEALHLHVAQFSLRTRRQSRY